MQSTYGVPERVLLVEAERTANTLEASFILNGNEHRASLRSSEEIGSEADSLLHLALLPAMRSRSVLRLPQPVSPRLLKATDMIQDIWRTWDEKYGRVNLEVEARDTDLARYDGLDKEALVLLNITGGGRQRQQRDKKLMQIQPSLEITEEERHLADTIDRIINLFH